MTTLILRSRKKAALKRLLDLAVQLDVDVTALDEEQKEEVAMLKAMREGLKSPRTSRASVMRALGRE